MKKQMNEVVLFDSLNTDSGHQIGVATLNVEKSLNALSVEMVALLHPQLESWQNDPTIVCVVLQGGEKSFCAGGDLRRLYETMVECGEGQSNQYAEKFFEQEYRLNYLIHQYKKPIIVWGHGIVMGGGIGLMSGASHRIVTETSRLAMPEINIGLFPDVGSTWFLNRTPGRTGLFLGLTGANMNGADALFIGLADYFVSSKQKSSVMGELLSVDWSNNLETNQQITSTLLTNSENRRQLPLSPVRQNFELINALTDENELTKIVQNILLFKTDDRWLQRAAKTLNKGCPVSAYIVYEQLRSGKNLPLHAVFQLELVVALQCTRHLDFREGIRALLIERDGDPQWQHSSIADVPKNYIDTHFKAPWGENKANPLNNLID